ncbi:hypothetical protein, partial [Brucella melitensis]|uniref:hypothetical protein n=1 Tax=Brucella melitensis TaxID=29459 RepID=UPI003B684FFE
CRYGGTDTDSIATGYNSGTALTDTGVSGTGVRVYKRFGAGMLTGNQIVSYSKSLGDSNVAAVVIVFDSETDIAGVTLHIGSMGGTPNAF